MIVVPLTHGTSYWSIMSWLINDIIPGSKIKISWYMKSSLVIYRLYDKGYDTKSQNKALTIEDISIKCVSSWAWLCWSSSILRLTVWGKGIFIESIWLEKNNDAVSDNFVKNVTQFGYKRFYVMSLTKRKIALL